MSCSIDPRIEAAFAEVFPGTGPLTAATTPADVKGWDSMNHIRFIIAVEEWVGIQFRPREVVRMRCVGDLHALVVSRVGSR